MSYLVILLIFIFWSVFYSIHSCLIDRTYTSARYAKFLSKNGFSVNIFQLKWYTVRCNRSFIKLSNIRPKFLKIWFNCGAFIGIIGQFLACFFLMYTLYDSFFDQKKPLKEQILVPVLPGVNLPANQTIYYFLALFICGIVHEFGHAIAASREQVRVNGFGVFIMFIFPGAYVDLCSDHLQIISPIRQLRIFCGGVWHNLVLVLAAVLIIQAHPYFLQTFFNKNAYVASINQNSPLQSLINTNSIISNIDTCKVKNRLTYYECLLQLESANHKRTGYCMPLPEILQMSSNFGTRKNRDPDLNECCSSNITTSSFCFKWENSKNKILNEISQNKRHFSCLPARHVTNKATCLSNIDCMKNADAKLKVICVKPISDNSTKLVKIMHNEGGPVLYVGSINELIYSIQIDDFRPKFRFIPNFFNSQLLLLLKYIVAFSGAIGLLNLVPCFALDGQYILAASLHLISQRNSPKNFIDLNSGRDTTPGRHQTLYASIMIFGTLLLVLNLFLAIFNLFVS